MTSNYKTKSIKCHDNYILEVEFVDGTKGLVSLEHILWGEVFEPLKDPEYFKKAFIDDFGVITWPNGADLAPDAMYLRIKNSRLKKINYTDDDEMKNPIVVNDFLPAPDKLKLRLKNK